jgi:hypothetical protein
MIKGRFVIVAVIIITVMIAIIIAIMIKTSWPSNNGINQSSIVSTGNSSLTNWDHLINFVNGSVVGIPTQNLTILGQLYDAGQPVISLRNEGFIQSGIIQNHTYGLNDSIWSNDEYPISLPFGNNSYSVGYAFTNNGGSDKPWFVIGEPFWLRFEKWDNVTHSVIRYESNKQYMYTGQPINIDLATDVHLVMHPYPADASYLTGMADNITNTIDYPYRGSPGQIFSDEFRDGLIQYNDYGVPEGIIASINAGLYDTNPPFFPLNNSTGNYIITMPWVVDNATVHPIGPQMVSSDFGYDYMQDYQFNTTDGKTHTSYVSISGSYGPVALSIDNTPCEFFT